MKLTIATLPTTRQDLSADGLLARLRERFQRIPDSRTAPDISLCDALLSGLALFALKDPSLLAFDQRRHERNFLALFGIHNVPSDTRLREILDKVDPGELRAAFIPRTVRNGVFDPQPKAQAFALMASNLQTPAPFLDSRKWFLEGMPDFLMDSLRTMSARI